MPIGFEAGDFGGGAADRTEWRTGGEAERDAALRGALDPWRDARQPADAAVEFGFWAWVEVERQILTPEVWTRWATVEDERVCPECGPLDGLVWPVGEGPAPPLHVNCRCARVHAVTRWSVRRTTEWALRWVARPG